MTVETLEPRRRLSGQSASGLADSMGLPGSIYGLKGLSRLPPRHPVVAGSRVIDGHSSTSPPTLFPEACSDLMAFLRKGMKRPSPRAAATAATATFPPETESMTAQQVLEEEPEPLVPPPLEKLKQERKRQLKQKQ